MLFSRELFSLLRCLRRGARALCPAAGAPLEFAVLPFEMLIIVHAVSLALVSPLLNRAAAPSRLIRVQEQPCAAISDLTTDNLKTALLEKAAAYKSAQEARWEEQAAEAAPKSAILNAESIANINADSACAELKSETIELIESLAERNPTPRPFENWRSTQGTGLDGSWELQFTTGADATFRKTNKTGAATTYQEIDSQRGMFVNCVDFDSPDAKLKGFRVYVAGKRIDDTSVQLKFRAVKLLRRSRLLKSIVIPLPPSWFLRGVAKLASRGKAKLSDRGAGFQLLYLDETLRMHKTFDGQYFVQTRKAASGASRRTG